MTNNRNAIKFGAAPYLKSMSTKSVTRVKQDHDFEITNPHLLKSINTVDAIMQVFVEPTLPEENKDTIREMLFLSIDKILEQFNKTQSVNLVKIPGFSSSKLTNSRFKLDYVADIIVQILSGETVPVQYPVEVANPVSNTLIQSKISLLLAQLSPKDKADLHPRHKTMLARIVDLKLNNDALISIQKVLESRTSDIYDTLKKIIEIINDNSFVREKLDLRQYEDK